MIAILLEVGIAEGQRDAYADMAVGMRGNLADRLGFTLIERLEA